MCKAVVAGNSLSLIKQDLVIGSGTVRKVEMGGGREGKGEEENKEHLHIFEKLCYYGCCCRLLARATQWK